MTHDEFPPLALAGWRPSRDTLHRYAKVLGAIRGELTPKQKHWRHISLRVTQDGLSTTAIPSAAAGFELLLDFSAHRLTIDTERGQARHVPLAGQAAATLAGQILAALAEMDIPAEIDRGKLGDAAPGEYDRAAVERCGHALRRIDEVFRRFKSRLGSGTSPVQFWPHHFDLAMSWFSGRLVPGVDPKDEEAAEEQMTFGFSTGDETIADPYFYITAYPPVAELAQIALPPGSSWNARHWQGAVMTYEFLTGVDRPEEKLLDFLARVQAAGAARMAG